VIPFAVSGYFEGVIHKVVVVDGIVITAPQDIEGPSIPDKIIPRDMDANGAFSIDPGGILAKQVDPDLAVCNNP